ncbi:unnamed protein product [Pedinophyceae sp. YPF-701]|nr:unnamed protein product [Pedinophyceae sp. YPF-701]
MFGAEEPFRALPTAPQLAQAADEEESAPLLSVRDVPLAEDSARDASAAAGTVAEGVLASVARVTRPDRGAPRALPPEDPFRPVLINVRKGPTPARALARLEGRAEVETYGIAVDDKPQWRDKWIDRAEQRLAHYEQAAERDGAAADDAETSRLLGAADVATRQNANGARGLIDENGLVLQGANPLRRELGRDPKRHDPMAPHLALVVREPGVAMLTSSDEVRKYRLDLEVPRVQLAAHPAMTREDWLASRLAAVYQGYRTREHAGLQALYSRRLMALEEELLEAREQLFGVAAGGADGAELGRARAQEAGRLELEVAATRAMLEREAAWEHGACVHMRNIYQQIEAERARQGFAMTGVYLQVEKDAGVGVAAGVDKRARRELDVRLAVAEVDDIVGLHRPPKRFPGFEEGDGAGGVVDASDAAAAFGGATIKLRRVETLVRAHAARRAELEAELLKLERVVGKGARVEQRDVDRQAELAAELAALGEFPRRAARAQDKTAQIEKRTREKVKKEGPLRVHRPARLRALLTLPDGPDALTAHQANRAAVLARTRVFAKLIVNGRVVAETEPRALQPDFSVDVGEVFSLQVVRWPDSVRLAIYQARKSFDLLLGECRVLLPGAGGLPTEDVQPVRYDFQSHNTFSPPWLPVEGDPAEEIQRRQAAAAAAHEAALAGATSSAARKRASAAAAAITEAALQISGACFVRAAWRPQPSTAAVGTAPRPAGALLDSGAASDAPRPPGAADIETGVDAAAQRLMPPPPPFAVADSRTAFLAQAQLAQWADLAGVDPNDPRGGKLLELLRAYRGATAAPGAVGAGPGSANAPAGPFRIAPPAEVVVGRRRVLAARRTRLLAMRWEAAGEQRRLGQPERAPLPVPLADFEVQELDGYRMLRQAGVPERMAAGKMSDQLGEARDTDIARRVLAAPSLKVIREREEAIRELGHRIEQVGRELARKDPSLTRRSPGDVVSELFVPGLLKEWHLIWGAVFDAFAPRSRLKPRRQRNAVPAQQAHKEVSIIVHVLQANNLPVRAAGRAGAGAASPYVEVLFQDTAARTSSGTGRDPVFNEAVRVMLTAPEGQELTPSFLHGCDFQIIVNVFDEIAVPAEPQARAGAAGTAARFGARGQTRATERTAVRVERRFLGSVIVPFNGLYQLGVIEGTFGLEVPLCLLGYDHGAPESAFGAPSIALYMATAPQLQYQPPEEVTAMPLFCAEPLEVQQRVAHFVEEASAKVPARPPREFNLMMRTVEGASWMALRFVAPLELPPGFEAVPQSDPSLLARLAWFVSRVPFVPDSSVSDLVDDVWMSSSEFVELAAGDFEEHALLLCGLFLQTGRQAFIVRGQATTGPESYFVLTTGQAWTTSRSSRTPTGVGLLPKAALTLWDPVSGQAYDVRDGTLPLRQVDVVMGVDNAWANVQAQTHPLHISWDLDNAREWRALFDLQEPIRKLASLQKPMVYRDHEPRFYEDLATKIQQEVKDLIQDARLELLNTNTWWDNSISTKLRHVLARDVRKYVERSMKDVSEMAGHYLADTVGRGLEQSAPQAVGTDTAAAVGGGGAGNAQGIFGARRAEDPVHVRAGRLRVGRYSRTVVSALTQSHLDYLRTETGGCTVTGTLLEMPFSTTEEVAQAVLNTDLHSMATEGVKFALAVRCEPMGVKFCFPIFVYLVAIHRDAPVIARRP